MSERAGVLVLGSVNLDLVLRSTRLPRAAETVADAELSESLGGKGANQAIAAARMGAAVELIACLGDDAAGRAARACLAHEGVGLERCRTVTGPTGRAAVLVDAAGENLISVAPAANARLAPADVEPAWPTSTRVLLTQLEIPPAAAAAGLRLARERGVTSVLNATPADRLDRLGLGVGVGVGPGLGRELGEPPDVLVVNRGEAEELTGCGRGDAAELAGTLARRRGIATVIVTDGDAGAGAAIDGGAGMPVHASAPEVDVRDTTGAGDAFAGALAALIAERMELARALELACVAGALACTTVGAAPALPGRAAVLAATVRRS